MDMFVNGPSSSNACVGNNGSPNYVEYANGYLKSSIILLEHVLNDDSDIDHLIYPICFGVRHSLELWIKGEFEGLREVAEIKRENFDFPRLEATHDLESLWGRFREVSESLDKRYCETNHRLNDFFVEVSTIDSNGQVFRYALSQESKKHLTEYGVINCAILMERVLLLKGTLGDLHSLGRFLKIEYETGTFTSELTRVELFDFAKKLPRFDEWSSESLNMVRDDLKREFSLDSNRAFNRVVEKIEGNYEAVSLMSGKLPLLGVTDDQVIELLSLAHDRLAKTKEAESLGSVTLLESLSRQTDFCADVNLRFHHLMEENVSDEYVAGMMALLRFSRLGFEFSEDYIDDYNQRLECYKSGVDNGKDDLRTVFENTYVLKWFLLSLGVLGREDLITILINDLKLEDLGVGEKSNRMNKLSDFGYSWP